MSELSDIRLEVSEIKGMLREHIVETKTYREQQSKVIEAHSQALWTKNGGLELRTDRLEVSESFRKKILWLFGSTTVGILLDKYFHFLPK